MMDFFIEVMVVCAGVKLTSCYSINITFNTEFVVVKPVPYQTMLLEIIFFIMLYKPSKNNI